MHAGSQEYSVELRWRDLDNQGHVYHGTILTLLDEARTRWLADVVQSDLPDSYVLARIEIDYRSPLEIDDQRVVVVLGVVRVGTTSITLREEMTSGRTRRLISQSLTTVVLWDRGTSSSRQFTATERSRLSASTTTA